MKNINLELDILRELFNISVGKASSLLSEIIDRKIILNVPDVKLINLENKEFNINECFPEKSDGFFMISSISFKNEVQGKASLIFPAKKIRTFIELCLKNDGTEEYFEMNFSDVDIDVIKEIGNIVLNSVVGEVGNLLELKLTYTLPEKLEICYWNNFVNSITNFSYEQVGVSFYPIDGDTIDKLITKADKEMYVTKRHRRRNTYRMEL